jgi:U3 small nucleolar RNA-associated protein 24
MSGTPIFDIEYRKIPGAPIMSVARGKYVIERLPDAPEK